VGFLLQSLTQIKIKSCQAESRRGGKAFAIASELEQEPRLRSV
jgi:hypothetical protein